MLNVQQVRLRFAFAKLLVLTSPICKRLGSKGSGSAELPRMAVVPRRNEICEMQISQVKNVQGGTFFTVPALYFGSEIQGEFPERKSR